jgi:hypothetical protein
MSCLSLRTTLSLKSMNSDYQKGIGVHKAGARFQCDNLRYIDEDQDDNKILEFSEHGDKK